MKLIHLSDLHLGKRINEFSMVEDQAYILREIMEIISEEKPDGVLIAGDVYDKPVPPAEAVQLLDQFLSMMAKENLQVFLISGNHDSAERVAFGGRIMEAAGIHVAPVYDGRVTPITLTDQYGPVDIYMLPFLKPAHLRRFYPEAEISDYTQAMEVAIQAMGHGDGGGIDTHRRNVLVTHQFVTGGQRSESEELSVGGADNVEASVFSDFDYVALGHLHAPQNISAGVSYGVVRYCGTPLKYSFSEAGHRKSVTVIELGEKGSVQVRTVPLIPKRDMRELRGTYMELTDRQRYEGTATEDYIHITLTDEEDIPDAMGKLRVIYPNLMKLDYDNMRTRKNGEIGGAADVERKSPFQLFSEFYEKQNNQPVSKEQEDFLQELIEKIWEGEE